MLRKTLPLVTLALLSCGGTEDPIPAVNPSFDIPTEWQSRESRIVMRLTNASSTSTEVRRALGNLFNGNPLVPGDDGIDPMQLLMRGATKSSDGTWAPAEAGLSDAEALAGTSIEQAAAFKARVIDEGGSFTAEEAVDACGNPMLMSVLTPEALATVIPGLEEMSIWPTSCASSECEPTTGSWDVALGERNFDGMIDMVINILPSVATDPVRPGAWGQLTALFLTGENPGESMVPLFLNMRRLQINLTNVWELDRQYADPTGLHEVYRFPHRARTLTQSDVFVFAEGYDKSQELWDTEGNADIRLPFGLDEASPVGIDYTASIGNDLIVATNRSGQLAPALGEALNYQISAAMACPGVRESAYVKDGPVELFLCPEGNVATCLAVNDMDEGACQFPVEPPPAFLDLNPIVFERYASEQGVAQIPASNLPSYLTAIGPTGEATVELEVTEDSAFYLHNADRVVSVVDSNGSPVAVPDPVGNGHCSENTALRFNVGSEWPAGTYTLTIDLTDNLDGVPDTGDEAFVDPTDGTFNTWFYFTSINAWIPN